MSNLILLKDWFQSNTEIWLPSSILYYDVSSWGRVRSYWNQIRNEGQRTGFRSVITSDPRVLNPKPSEAHGYIYVCLHMDGKLLNRRVHRMVAETFHGTSASLDVNHRNSVKTDNRMENLEWLSRSDHKRRTFDAGLKPQGESHGMSKLTADAVRNIRRAKERGIATFTLAALYDVAPSTIRRVASRETWDSI